MNGTTSRRGCAKVARRAAKRWCAAAHEVRRRKLTVPQKIIWTILMAGLVGLLYLAFRGYLTPAMLIDFANTMLC